MKPLLAFLFALICTLSICCRREIPDPPLTGQTNGVPDGTGPCEVTFYSNTQGRTFELTIDGIYQASFGGSLYTPGCGDPGTPTLHLSAGTHTVAYHWFQGTSSGTGSFSFSLTSGNCMLYSL